MKTTKMWGILAALLGLALLPAVVQADTIAVAEYLGSTTGGTGTGAVLLYNTNTGALINSYAETHAIMVSFDGSDNLWSMGAGSSNTLYELPKGASSPTQNTLSPAYVSTSYEEQMHVEAGQVFVAQYSGIAGFTTAGAWDPGTPVSLKTGINGLTVDASDNVYITDNTSNSPVELLKSAGYGYSAANDLPSGPHVSGGGGLTFDLDGNLWEINGRGSSATAGSTWGIWATEYTQTSGVWAVNRSLLLGGFTGLNASNASIGAGGIAFDNDGDLWVSSNANGGAYQEALLEWSPATLAAAANGSTVMNTGSILLNNGAAGDVLVEGISISTPEPLSMIFFGTGLIGIGGYVARRRMLKG